MVAKPSVVLGIGRQFVGIAAVSSFSILKSNRHDVKIYWIAPGSNVDLVQERIENTKYIDQYVGAIE